MTKTATNLMDEYEQATITGGGFQKNPDGTHEFSISVGFWRSDSPNMVDSYNGTGKTLDEALVAAIEKEREDVQRKP